MSSMECSVKKEPDLEIVSALDEDSMSYWNSVQSPIIETHVKLNEAIIIEALRDRPALWDHNHNSYSCRATKYELWREVVRALSMEDNHDNVVKVRKRWDYIRTCYRNIRLKQFDPAKTACGKKFKDKLSFLDKVFPVKYTNSGQTSERYSPFTVVHRPFERPSLNDSASLNSEADDSRELIKESVKEEKHKQHNKSQTSIAPQKRTAQDAFYDMLDDLMKDLSEPQKHKVRLKLLQQAGELCFDDDSTKATLCKEKRLCQRDEKA